MPYGTTGNPFNVQTGAIPWTTIIIMAFIGFVLYLIFKK